MDRDIICRIKAVAAPAAIYARDLYALTVAVNAVGETLYPAADMRATKKLTLGAVMTALGVAFMALGAYVEVLDFSALALVSLLMVFMCIEVGAPYNWLTYAATSLLGAVFFTSRPVWGMYLLIFGIYPILKGFIERFGRGFWIPVKLVTFNLLFIPAIFLSQLISGIPFFSVGELNLPDWLDPRLVIVALYVICNVAFALYDAFLTSMIRFYFARLRPRFVRFLK